MRNFPVGYIDWAEATRINTQYGTTPLENDNLQNVFDCISQRTVNPDALPEQSSNAKWYIFRTKHVTPKLLKGYMPISEQKGGAVLYYGAFQKTGDEVLSFFPQDTDWTMPPRNTPVDIKTENRHFVLDSNNTPCPLFWVSPTEEGKTPYVNWNSIGFFKTENGGKFGASLCINEAAGQSQKASSVIVHSFGDYRYMNHSSATRSLRGNWWHNSISNTDHAYYPKFGANEMFLGTPNNDNCLNSTAVSATRWALDEGAMLLKNDVSAEFFCTVINDEKYVGLAACEWDDDAITAIEICLLPAWFWGNVNYEIDEDLPDAEDIWYGPEVSPQPGVGTHTITQGGVSDASGQLPTHTVWDLIRNSMGGAHVYKLNGSAYSELLTGLWTALSDEQRQATLGAIVAVHQIPNEITPLGSAATAVNTLAFGNIGAPLIHSGSTAHIVNPIVIRNHICSWSVDDRYNSLARTTGCYLDFEPHTNVSLYLPFAGTVQIPASQCIGGSIVIDTICDASTGDLCYIITAKSDESILHDANNNPLENKYYATGNCAVSLPVFGTTTGERQKLSGVLEKVGAISQMVSGVAQAATPGGQLSGVSSVVSGMGRYAMASYDSDPRHISTQTINAGGISGNTSLIGPKQIILSVTRPAEAYDDFWIALNGTPANVKTKIFNIMTPKSDSVFAMDASNKIEFDDATVAEKAAIHDILVGGVYL